MTRTLRQDPATGKPLPSAPRPDDDTWDEPTVADRLIPSTEELIAELDQHASAGQGDDFPWTFTRGPRR
jgi:hypothetical protein